MGSLREEHRPEDSHGIYIRREPHPIERNTLQKEVPQATHSKQEDEWPHPLPLCPIPEYLANQWLMPTCRSLGKRTCARDLPYSFGICLGLLSSSVPKYTGKVERTQGIGVYRYWRRYLQPILNKPHFQTLFQELLNHSLPYVPAAGETPWRPQDQLDAVSTLSKSFGLLTLPTPKSSQSHNPSREVVYGHPLTWIFLPTHYLSSVMLAGSSSTGQELASDTKTDLCMVVSAALELEPIQDSVRNTCLVCLTVFLPKVSPAARVYP